MKSKIKELRHAANMMYYCEGRVDVAVEALRDLLEAGQQGCYELPEDVESRLCVIINGLTVTIDTLETQGDTMHYLTNAIKDAAAQQLCTETK